EQLQPAAVEPFGDAGGVGRVDAGVEHRGGGAGGDFLPREVAEGPPFLRSEPEKEARVGAELPDAGGEGGGETPGDVFGPGLEGAREEEDGVDAAHLGVEGDGARAGVGRVEEGAASGERSGEGGGGDAGMAHEAGAGLVAAAVDQRED